MSTLQKYILGRLDLFKAVPIIFIAVISSFFGSLVTKKVKKSKIPILHILFIKLNLFCRIVLFLLFIVYVYVI